MKNGSGWPKKVRQKSQLLSEQLLAACLESKVGPQNALSLFEAFQSLTSALTTIQHEFCFIRSLERVSPNRIDAVRHLLNTHTECVAQPVSVDDFRESGLGLTAVSSLPESSCILRIPRKLFLANTKDDSSPFDSFIRNDPIASTMPNVALALRLLSELALWDKSKYFDYIKSLPPRCSTFLYMELEELKSLRGSKALESIVSNFQCICRQYAYFSSHIAPTGLPISSCFCYEDYRWAVSIVMSRNSLVPDPTGSSKHLCLVPIWDMINFKTGTLTTDFDIDSDELVFYAMESVAPNKQIFMDYGKRSNTDLFMFAGFVPLENPHNHVSVQLGLSQADQLAPKRLVLIQRVGLESPLTRNLTTDMLALVDLVTFSRIFIMTEAELESHLKISNPSEHLCSPSISCPDDDRALDFLKNRFRLLMMAYGTVGTEEDADAQDWKLVRRFCERLKRQEVNILRMAIEVLEDSARLPTVETS